MDVHATTHALATVINLAALVTVIIGHATANVIITTNAFATIHALAIVTTHALVTVTIVHAIVIKRHVDVTHKDKRYYQ